MHLCQAATWKHASVWLTDLCVAFDCCCCHQVKMDLLLKTSSRSALQTAAWVYEREGVAGFWKGNGLNLLRTAPFKVRLLC